MKTLLFPIALVLGIAAILPADGQVPIAFGLSTQKEYRQSKGGITFYRGNVETFFRDGLITYYPECSSLFYYAPFIDPFDRCNIGTTAYLELGTLDDTIDQVVEPYLAVPSVVPALFTAPFKSEAVQLVAFPASSLDKSLFKFTDRSVILDYNLHGSDIQQYTVTRYTENIPYPRNGRSRMESDIKPGSYKFTIPRISETNSNTTISHQLYPMLEGLARINNKTSGFYFSKINNNKWTNDGFVEFSFRLPNRVEWQGVTTNSVFPNADNLYLSARAISDPNNSRSDVLTRGSSLFPGFQGGAGVPRVSIPNVLNNKYTFPPLFPSGTKGIIEVEYDRLFPTGSFTYDLSTRRFQVPFVVIDRYSEYVKTVLTKTKIKAILDDADGDGFNNLTEWILDSNPLQSSFIPRNPRPETSIDRFRETSHGFVVELKTGTVPSVNYTLQYSPNGGLTWIDFVDGYYRRDAAGTYSANVLPADRNQNGTIIANTFNWVVSTETQTIDGLSRKVKTVKSLVSNDSSASIRPTDVPAGVENWIFRNKITLAQ